MSGEGVHQRKARKTSQLVEVVVSANDVGRLSMIRVTLSTIRVTTEDLWDEMKNRFETNQGGRGVCARCPSC